MYRTRRSTRRLLATTCVAVVAWAGVTACGEAGTAAVAAYKFVKKPYWA